MRAVASGDSRGAFMMGIIFLGGCGTIKQDYEKAAEWFTRAANIGCTDGLVLLARMYIEGAKYVEKDKSKAL
jgi:TPR repeat protein